MAEFFVEKLAQNSGYHVVHKSDCALLPKSKEAIHYLGSISTCKSALKKAGELFKPVNGCAECSTDCYTA